MEARRPTRILLVFLDGVGLGEPDPTSNPFVRAELPTFEALLGGHPPTLAHPALGGAHPDAPPPNTSLSNTHARLLALDATLGVPGLPQSGTGQIALLTGRNAPRLFGRHFGPWPPVRLRPLLEDENLLVRAVGAGLPAAFANAYPAGYPDSRPSRRVAAPPLAAAAAGLLDRDQGALARGEAVASEIVNDGWRRHLGFSSLPEVTPAGAGRHLARIARDAALTLYAHYSTDHAGHRGGMTGAIEALERVDRFLSGIVEELPDDTLLLVTSDHGNIETVGQGHTLNPALGLARGPGAERFDTHLPLTRVAPLALELLGVPSRHGSAPPAPRSSEDE